MNDNRLEGALDAVLHLLDRQVVDADGLMVCKVDDVELTEWPDCRLAVTGLLSGAAALLPRLGGGLGGKVLEQWWWLGVERHARTAPWRIDLDVVDEVGSGVRLTVPRTGLRRRQGPPAAGTRQHRLGELLGLPVRGPGGQPLGRVVDVRLEPEREHPGRRILVTALVIGRGRPGGMLGYDRRGEQGPTLVRIVVRWLHRHTGQAPASAAGIDWDDRHVTLATELEPLRPP